MCGRQGGVLLQCQRNHRLDVLVRQQVFVVLVIDLHVLAGFVLVDDAGRKVSVDRHLLARHGVEGEARRDLGDAARALGDDDEVDDDEDDEDDEDFGSEDERREAAGSGSEKEETRGGSDNEEEEEDEESGRYSHFTSHQGQRGFGRGRGGNVVYCSSQ